MGPLSIKINTQDTKTGVPMFADGSWVHLRLTGLDSAAVENKGTVLKWKWELIDPAPSVDSSRDGTCDPIYPGKFGSSYFESIQLYDKNTDFSIPEDQRPAPDWAVKKICARLDGLLNTGDPGNKKGKDARPQFDEQLVPQLLGKALWAQMKVRTGEYEGNEISKIMSEADYAKP